MSKTFVMLKPDALERHLDKNIIDTFILEGYEILRQKRMTATKDTIISHYEEVIKRLDLEYFTDAIIDAFDGKDVIVLELKHSKKDAIQSIRELIGATDPSKADKESIRGKFGKDSFELASKEKRMIQNLIHASDSVESYQKEVTLWFE
ncbi:MAG: nucleoside-diphosphate kinase [Acholeplasmataceae bacterium]|jgi:nucleoside-diphosphate kinase